MGILTPRKWLVIATVSLTAAFMQPVPGRAETNASRPLELFEEKIKAGLVYNFLKYTTWPNANAAAQKGLKVCLFGSNPVNEYLDPLAGKYAQQFVISIVHIDGIQEASDCSMVFISNSEKDNMPDLLVFLKNKHVLTVSDIDQFAQDGGMVEFAKENQRITFYINTKAVKLAGLGIEERLLKLAKLVPG